MGAFHGAAYARTLLGSFALPAQFSRADETPSLLPPSAGLFPRLVARAMWTTSKEDEENPVSFVEP